MLPIPGRETGIETNCSKHTEFLNNIIVYENGRGFSGNHGGRECYNCGETGYISRACPRKTKSPAPAGDTAVLSGGVEKSKSLLTLICNAPGDCGARFSLSPNERIIPRCCMRCSVVIGAYSI